MDTTTLCQIVNTLKAEVDDARRSGHCDYYSPSHRFLIEINNSLGRLEKQISNTTNATGAMHMFRIAVESIVDAFLAFWENLSGKPIDLSKYPKFAEKTFILENLVDEKPLHSWIKSFKLSTNTDIHGQKIMSEKECLIVVNSVPYIVESLYKYATKMESSHNKSQIKEIKVEKAPIVKHEVKVPQNVDGSSVNQVAPRLVVTIPQRSKISDRNVETNNQVKEVKAEMESYKQEKERFTPCMYHAMGVECTSSYHKHGSKMSFEEALAYSKIGTKECQNTDCKHKNKRIKNRDNGKVCNGCVYLHDEDHSQVAANRVKVELGKKYLEIMQSFAGSHH